MIGHGKWQASDHDIGECLARNVDSLPKTVCAEEHGVDVILKLLEHRRPRCASALDNAAQAEFFEKRFHHLRYLKHQLEIGEENKGLAVSHLDKMFDPMNEGIAITGLAWVGHLRHDKNLHLLLVIER